MAATLEAGGRRPWIPLARRHRFPTVAWEPVPCLLSQHRLACFLHRLYLSDGHSQPALSGEADSRKSADGSSSGFLGCMSLFLFQQDD